MSRTFGRYGRKRIASFNTISETDEYCTRRKTNYAAYAIIAERPQQLIPTADPSGPNVFCRQTTSAFRLRPLIKGSYTANYMYAILRLMDATWALETINGFYGRDKRLRTGTHDCPADTDVNCICIATLPTASAGFKSEPAGDG